MGTTKKLWIKIVELFGWKFDIPERSTRPELEHCVLIMAPHTSILDFFVGAACVWKLEVNSRIFMKKEFFNWFTKPFLNHFGVVPVDRGNKKNHLTEYAVDLFRKNENFSLVITPEGTRKYVRKWKRGFYEIAIQAEVPVVMTYVDFKKKTMGIGPTFHPTGDFNADMIEMMTFYKDITPRHPEKFCTSTQAYENRSARTAAADTNQEIKK